MDGAALLVVMLVVTPLLGLVLSYNRFVSQRTLVRNAWANIDVELRRRYDLIPNLVETVKGYAAHERDLFEAVTRARAAAMSSNGSAESQAADERPVVDSMRRLLAVAEDYPDLRASEQFAELQVRLVETENRLAAARRFYNGNVRDLNRRVEAFPSNIVAGWFKFGRATYFEVDEVLGQADPPSAATG